MTVKTNLDEDTYLKSKIQNEVDETEKLIAELTKALEDCPADDTISAKVMDVTEGLSADWKKFSSSFRDFSNKYDDYVNKLVDFVQDATEKIASIGKK